MQQENFINDISDGAFCLFLLQLEEIDPGEAELYCFISTMHLTVYLARADLYIYVKDTSCDDVLMISLTLINCSNS